MARPTLAPLAALALAAVACAKEGPAPHRELLHLRGSPYQRGLQHGQALKSKIHSFYTTLLSTSLLPYLNREQSGIAAFLPQYQDARFQNGQFSYQLLLDSAYKLQRSIPAAYQDEMKGIADGSGMSYDQILVLNTFVDATLGVRAVAGALHLSGAPTLVSVEFVGADHDDADNNGDGQTDEAGEGLFSPYAPSASALAVEVSPTTALRFVLVDPDGVDPATVRLALGDKVYTQGDPALSFEAQDGGRLQVTLQPGKLPEASTLSVSIVAGDLAIVNDPPPAHAHFMREERIAFTTRGAGKKPWEVPNVGGSASRGRPTSIAFAVTGSATPDGKPRLAQHFALLDANTSHDHTAVFVHHPDNGAPFVVVGWAGIAWGFSGMNAAGLAVACQPSDTLDNSVVGNLLNSAADLSKAKVIASGSPIGFAERHLLETTNTTADALAQMRTTKFAYGWGCLLADAAGSLRAVEIDSDVDNKGTGGIYDYGTDPTEPGAADAHGRPWASVGPDDLRFAGHYLKNHDDMYSLAVQGAKVMPQSQWASTYFRSAQAQAALGDALAARLGHLDSAAAQEVLSLDQLVDPNDSMNAVVLEPASRLVHSAMGTEPATHSPFETLDLAAERN